MGGRTNEQQKIAQSAVALTNEVQKLREALVETENWIIDLAQRLRWPDRSKVYLALLGTLHALRNSLPRVEAVYVGAQMPVSLRGVYHEAWYPGARLLRIEAHSWRH